MMVEKRNSSNIFVCTAGHQHWEKYMIKFNVYANVMAALNSTKNEVYVVL